MNQARFGLAGCGTTSDALSFNGYSTTGPTYYANTEIWNGTA